MEQIITDEIQKKDEETIFQGLLSYNLERLDDRNPKDVGIYYKDDGIIVAGLIGQTHGNWLTVKYLWVKENLRGQHIGTNLLEQAEKTAKERGCRYSFLDTFSFQAPQFYKKQGYREVLTLEKYPVSGKRHYFTKTL
ncbi:MAG: GNAT family N-acetyltransferase [Bacillus sp. (in: firmicutes)]